VAVAAADCRGDPGSVTTVTIAASASRRAPGGRDGRPTGPRRGTGSVGRAPSGLVKRARPIRRSASSTACHRHRAVIDSNSNLHRRKLPPWPLTARLEHTASRSLPTSAGGCPLTREPAIRLRTSVGDRLAEVDTVSTQPSGCPAGRHDNGAIRVSCGRGIADYDRPPDIHVRLMGRPLAGQRGHDHRPDP